MSGWVSLDRTCLTRFRRPITPVIGALSTREYTTGRRRGQWCVARVHSPDMSSDNRRSPSTDSRAGAAGGRASRVPTRRFSWLTGVRAGIAGLLMGIANLIPGVSGGTMILAMGLYEEFIDSIADLTALRFSRRRIVFLGIIGLSAAGAILGLAGVILYLLFHHTIAMFALFIGLTLGGAPLLFK